MHFPFLSFPLNLATLINMNRESKLHNRSKSTKSCNKTHKQHTFMVCKGICPLTLNWFVKVTPLHVYRRMSENLG